MMETSPKEGGTIAHARPGWSEGKSSLKCELKVKPATGETRKGAVKPWLAWVSLYVCVLWYLLFCFFEKANAPTTCCAFNMLVLDPKYVNKLGSM